MLTINLFTKVFSLDLVLLQFFFFCSCKSCFISYASAFIELDCFRFHTAAFLVEQFQQNIYGKMFLLSDYPLLSIIYPNFECGMPVLSCMYFLLLLLTLESVQ